MKTYLEALGTIDTQADFIRVDITGKTKPEVSAIQAAIEDIMLGLSYRLTRHYCPHYEGGSCTAEIIK